MIIKLRALIILSAALLVAACGGSSSSDEKSTEPARDITPEVQAYYKAHPDFFTFKTMADLPKDLKWQDGMDLPEIGSPDAKKGGTLYGAISDFPRTLRTVGPDSNGSFRPYILDDTFISLAQRHPDKFDFYPGTAKAWAVDKKNKTVYVKLNPKARWSDGVPVTTDDFMFMFFFFQSKYIVAPWYNNWYGTQYTNITKYDDHTFSISVPDAKPNMDARVLGLSGVPEHFYKELGDDFVQRYQWRFVPTTGPYVVKKDDINKGRSIALTRLKDWWAKDNKFFKYRYNPDRIQLQVIRETPKIFEAFKRGDLDEFGLNIPEYWYEKLPDNDPDVQAGYIYKTTFYNNIPRPPYGLSMNMSRTLLANQDVRIGINYATNWQLVIDKFFRGDYARLQSAQDGYGEWSNPNVKARPFDIDKAMEHFAKAGFTKRGPDGILVNDKGERLSLTLTTGYEAYKDILTILKQEAAKAGLEFRLEVLDGTASWKKVQEKKHDIYFGAFNVGVEMYPRFWEFYDSSNAYDKAFLDDCKVNPDRKVKVQTNNLEEFANCDMDKMIAAYRASADKDEMIDLAHKMEQLHHDTASFVPGFYRPFYRIGYWRWVRWPKYFNQKYSTSPGEYWVQWIDTDMKKETEEARKSGKSFGPEIKVYDQFRQDRAQ